MLFRGAPLNGLGRLWALIPAGYCRQLVCIAVALSALSAVIALVPALVVSVIAAVLFDRIDIRLSVMQVVFVGIASAIARLGFLLLARNTAGTATILVTRGLRADAAAKIGALPLGVLAQSRSGSFETILLDDVETIGQFVSERMVDIAGAYAMLLAATIVLYARDWRFASVAVAITLAAWVVFALRGARASNDIERERTTREELAAAVFGSVRSLALERSLPAAPGVAHPIRSLAHAYRCATDERLARAASLQAGRRAFAGSLAAIVVLAFLWFGGTGLDSIIVLFAAIALRTTGAMSCAFTARAASAPAFESARRIGALLANASVLEGTTQLSDDTALRFAGASFAYPTPAGSGGETAREVVRDIDFVAEAGKVTALVGPSGSGKTTLTRLAARFWDVDRGAVHVGNVDVRAVPSDALMQRVACVFQDVALLDDTVCVNLKLGRPDASDEEMVEAAQAAGAHAFITALPAQYGTVIGDRGLRLSRGERQRLQIARALLKDAPIVILDEPTASLDPATEAEIQEALVPLLRGKTVLVVAHRLSTIVDADRIVVLGRDGIVEAQGTHAELLDRSATYAHLWEDYRAPIEWMAAPVSGATRIVAR